MNDCSVAGAYVLTACRDGKDATKMTTARMEWAANVSEVRTYTLIECLDIEKILIIESICMIVYNNRCINPPYTSAQVFDPARPSTNQPFHSWSRYSWWENRIFEWGLQI
jgi:hypothetical protein